MQKIASDQESRRITKIDFKMRWYIYMTIKKWNSPAVFVLKCVFMTRDVKFDRERCVGASARSPFLTQAVRKSEGDFRSTILLN